MNKTAIGICTGDNRISFKLNGENICNGNDCKCEIRVFRELVFSDITLKVDHDTYIIPLSDSEESKKELIESLKDIQNHNADIIKTSKLGHRGSYLNCRYRDKEDSSFVKRYPTTITHASSLTSDDEWFELTIVKDCDNIFKFKLDFSLDVLIKALER